MATILVLHYKTVLQPWEVSLYVVDDCVQDDSRRCWGRDVKFSSLTLTCHAGQPGWFSLSVTVVTEWSCCHGSSSRSSSRSSLWREHSPHSRSTASKVWGRDNVTVATRNYLTESVPNIFSSLNNLILRFDGKCDLCKSLDKMYFKWFRLGKYSKQVRK